MDLESYIISIITTALGVLVYYWFNKINSRLESFFTIMTDNKHEIAISNSRIDNIVDKADELKKDNKEKHDELKYEMTELAKDMRSMLKTHSDLVKVVIDHNSRINTLEFKFSSKK